MIIKTSFRQSGGLEAHLRRNDTNEAVEVRLDLIRGPFTDLHDGLRLMEGLSRSNDRVSRSFVHIVIAPDHALSNSELQTTLAAIEAEHGIGSSSPRAVVEHTKGCRAAHFHAVYSIVDIETGRAIKSHNSFDRDEFVCRRLELQFGETVTPGPRLARNIAELRRRSLHHEADRLEAFSSANKDPDSPDRAERQQAERLGVRGASLSAEIYACFERARDLGEFGRALSEAGFLVCRGGKAVLVTQEDTGFSMSLTRCLRREAKAAGRPLSIREADIAKAFEGVAAFSEARDQGLRNARQRASRAVDSEYTRGALEAAIDADMEGLAFFRAQRKKREEAEASERKRALRTLRARRKEIVALYRELDIVRNRRVDRAFRIARLIPTERQRRLAFGLAALGVLMAGGSLVLALATAGVVLNTFSYGKARRAAANARREKLIDKRDRDVALDKIAQEAAARGSSERARQARFSFDHVSKQDRAIAGSYARRLIRGETAGVAELEAALGPLVVGGLRRTVERGSSLQVRRLLHWAGRDEPRAEVALRAALDRHRALFETPATSHVVASMTTDRPRSRPSDPKPGRRSSNPKRGPSRNQSGWER